MQTLDWIIVLILNGGVLAVGFFLARGTDSSEEWFLGRRTLTWWAIGLSMFATNVDNADLVSLTGTSYREGLHILMVHTLGAFIGVIFAAFVLAPAIARAGQYTNAEYLETRFGVSTRVLSAVIQIQYRHQHARADDLFSLPFANRPGRNAERSGMGIHRITNNPHRALYLVGRIEIGCHHRCLTGNHHDGGHGHYFHCRMARSRRLVRHGVRARIHQACG